MLVQSQVKNPDFDFIDEVLFVFICEVPEFFLPFFVAFGFFAINEENKCRLISRSIYKLLEGLSNNLPYFTFCLFLWLLLTPVIRFEPLHPIVLDKLLGFILQELPFVIFPHVPFQLERIVVCFRDEEPPQRPRYIFQQVSE